MDSNEQNSSQSTPKHLWIVGVLALLWNSMGAYDYLMTQTRNEAYLDRFPPELLEWVYSFPLWAECSWAIAIWSSVLASILLLMRKGLAAPIFGVSLVAMVLNSIYSYVISNGIEIMGGGAAIFSAVIFSVILGLFLYSRAMKAKGVLS
jgi:hypothetical protein